MTSLSAVKNAQFKNVFVSVFRQEYLTSPTASQIYIYVFAYELGSEDAHFCSQRNVSEEQTRYYPGQPSMQ